MDNQNIHTSGLRVNRPVKPWSVRVSLVLLTAIIVVILAVRQHQQPAGLVPLPLPAAEIESWMLEGLSGIGPQRAPVLLDAIQQALAAGVILDPDHPQALSVAELDLPFSLSTAAEQQLHRWFDLSLPDADQPHTISD